MDEFLVAIMSGIAILTYTFLNYLFTKSPIKEPAGWTAVITIVLLVVIYLAKRSYDKRRWTKMGLDAETYMFYQKYTSLGNKISYVFTYLLQDFIYEVKRTNKAYNFSKGMFRFDDSLGEYYVDCRMAWYSYFRTNLLKNRLSLHKLRIFSLEKCNQMILELFPEQAETYKQVKKGVEAASNEYPLCLNFKKKMVHKVEGAKGLHAMILQNLFRMEKSRRFMMENTKRYQTMLKKAEKRKEDVREIKNISIDLNHKDK